MATFTGRTSPTALAALAPSITNLAAAQRAKSQAAAGLMNTLGVQFEKQKQQEARKQKNQAAQQVAEGLLKDEAFRRQVPGISNSADLVKLVGAENVIEYGMKSQQADRLAQQSAAQIALTRKQIEQYDIDAKQREADLAAKKAEGEAFQQLVSAGGKLSDDQLGSILSGLNPDAQVRAISLRNQLDPSKAYDIVDLPNGESALIYGNQMMRISTQEKSKLPEAYTQGLALINEQFEKGTPEYDRAVQDLTDRTLGYDVSSGETAFGGQPAAAGPLSDVSESAVSFFQKIPEDRVTDVFLKDGQTTPEFDQYLSQLAEAGVSGDIISGVKTIVEQRAEEDRMGRFARGEFGGEEEEKPGFLDRLISGGGSVSPAITFGGIRYPTDTSQRPLGGGIREFLSAGPGPQLGPARPSARVPAVVTGQPGPGIPGGMASVKRTIGPIVEDIKKRIEIYEDAGLSFSFNRAKKLAQERVRSEQGRNQKTVLKELKDIDLKSIGRKPKNASEAKAQSTMLEVLTEMLDMPPFVEQYGLDELPAEIAKFVRDMIPVTERERLRRERSNRNQSTVTPVE